MRSPLPPPKKKRVSEFFFPIRDVNVRLPKTKQEECKIVIYDARVQKDGHNVPFEKEEDKERRKKVSKGRLNESSE